jgi:hypothetical protein
LLLAAWLAAVAATPGAALLTVLGQGLGAAAGGCEWIGATVPVDRQPWALVNQPSVAFAAQPVALPYWLGGVAAALLWTVSAIALVPRPRTTTWELVVCQSSWMVAVVGLGWYPLIDLWDGHVSRMLTLHQLPGAWVWLVPVVGAWCALVPASRVVSVARGFEPNLSRAGRLWAVILYLALPAITWVAAATWMRIRLARATPPFPNELSTILGPIWLPAVGATFPVLAALLLAWFVVPQAHTRSSPGAVVGPLALLAIVAAVALAVQWYAGGPAADGARRGVLWTEPGTRNNLRSWVAARALAAEWTDPESVLPR